MPDFCKCFTNSIEAAWNDCHTANAEERWNYICVAIYNSAMDTFCMRERQNLDCFEEGIAALDPSITVKRTVLVEYKRDPSEKSLAALRKARNNSQLIAGCCTNDYWLNLCQNIQLSTVCGNIHAMYDGMKKAFGPSATKITPSSPPLATLSQTEANKWRGRQNTTRSSTQGRTLSLTQLPRVPVFCLSWKSLMFHPQ